MSLTPEPATGRSSATPPASAPHRLDGDQGGTAGLLSGPLTAEQRDQVLRLAGAATAEDGVAPLSEHVMLHLRYAAGNRNRDTERSAGAPPAPGLDLLSMEAGQVAGYAYLDAEGAEGASGELVVDPGRRRRGHGKALLAALTEHAGGPLRVWAHGDLPAAAALARTAGLRRVRVLWQMRRPLRDPLPDPVRPPGIRLRTFVPGRDEDEWLRVNSRAFASHPEQGAWTRSDLVMREREDWFDPAGFFLAERDGRLAGFHWTKVHSAGPAEPAGPAGTRGTSGLGEVYVVGVDPGEQGTGLGRMLTLAGLRYLRDDRGLAEVMLYVDESNRAAIRLYGSLGFERTATDVMYG
jgi:mycothiol synthase